MLKENLGVGISLTEANMLCHKLPRDTYGRSDVREFKNALFEVRFLNMKNTMIQSQATDLEQYLFSIFQEEERREELKNDSSFINPVNMLPLRNIINLMVASTRLSLNRMQVVVISSEARVVDGLVDYR